MVEGTGGPTRKAKVNLGFIYLSTVGRGWWNLKMRIVIEGFSRNLGSSAPNRDAPITFMPDAHSFANARSGRLGPWVAGPITRVEATP